MKRKVLFWFSIIVVFLPGLAASEIFVNEGFEDGAFTPPVQYLCNLYLDPPECTNTAEHVTGEKKAGNYSLECVFNMHEAAGIRIFASDYGHAAFANKTYFRIYMKWDSDFRFYNRTKIFRSHVPDGDIYLNTNACVAEGVAWKDGWMQGFSSCSRYGELTFERTGTNTLHTVTNEIGNSDWVVEVGTGWYMIEFYYDASTTNYIVWMMRPGDLSPTQVISQSYGGPTSAGSTTGFDINWINSVDDGSGGKNWLDEIVIADEYIGPIGGDVPSSPLDFETVK